MFIIHATPGQIVKYSLIVGVILAVMHDAYGWF